VIIIWVPQERQVTLTGLCVDPILKAAKQLEQLYILSTGDGGAGSSGGASSCGGGYMDW